MRQVDDVQTEFGSDETCGSRHDDGDAGALRRVGEREHAVGETEQNALLHGLPLRGCGWMCGYGSCRRLI